AAHKNRLIKVPNTAGAAAAIEDLVAAGVPVNAPFTFTPRQYIRARDAAWRGAQRRKSLDAFKSVYSIFVSRVDVYTEHHVPGLSKRAQGQVGIVNAKRIWEMNKSFWAKHHLPLQQEMIFASTGIKNPTDPPWKYVGAFAGSDIETNPPPTNMAGQETKQTFTREVDKMPSREVLTDIDMLVDVQKMEDVLMEEGIKKFAEPQHALLALLAQKRTQLGK